MPRKRSRTQSKLLSREHAARLTVARERYLAAEELIALIKQRQEEAMKRLAAIHEFAGIPLDAADLNVPIDEPADSPVRVTWKA